LARHLRKEDKTAVFDVVPEPKEDELDETLHLACIALIGMMVVVNEMNGFTEGGKASAAERGARRAANREIRRAICGRRHGNPNREAGR